MGLETGTYISDLDPNNPVDATDPVSQGDDHLRLIKSTILNTFPNIQGEMSLSHEDLNNAAIQGLDNSINFAGTQEPDLLDTGNTLNLGTLTGAHIALGPSIIQAKTGATGAADLVLNPLGGALQAGFGGAITLKTIAEGIETGPVINALRTDDLSANIRAGNSEGAIEIRADNGSLQI
jgi:hypothetical protein